MAYSKQNFQDGQILNAANLEAMENGIIAGQGAHNLLDNSDFRNPVNSRGKTSYSIDGNEYTIDRWKTQYSTGLTIENGYINVIGGWQIYQTIKNPKDGVYTFAAEIRINSIGDNQPNMYISDGTEVLLDAPIGQWKTYILQYDLSSIESDNISFSLSARGGNNSNASISARWAAMYKGSYTADTLPSYVPKGKRVEMLNCGISLAPHNLLDNSDFRNPVNQRGQSSYNGITYTIDRWRSWDSNNTTTLNDGSISVSVHMVQNIPKNRFKNGSAYTIALCALDGTIYVNSGVYAPDAEDFGDWTHTWVEITDSGDVAIYLRNGTYVWAALYEGSYDASTLPAYQPKGYAAELAECKRYYQTRDISNYKVVVLGEELYFAIEHPDMRIAPSITIINPIANENNSIANLASGGKFATEIRTITKDRSIIYVATGTSGKSYAVSYTASADL